MHASASACPSCTRPDSLCSIHCYVTRILCSATEQATRSASTHCFLLCSNHKQVQKHFKPYRLPRCRQLSV